MNTEEQMMFEVQRRGAALSSTGFSLWNCALRKLIAKFGKRAKSEQEIEGVKGQPPHSEACVICTRLRMALLILACGVAAFCAARFSGSAPTRDSLTSEVLRGASFAPVSLGGAAPQLQFATGLGVRIYDGTNTMLVDPCKGQTKQFVSINQTANVQLTAGTASKKIYVCSIHVVVASAANVALVEGTGSACGTGTAGVPGFGGATAATGWNFGANGGIALGNGDSSLGAEANPGDNLCLINSGSGQVSGGLSYVVQ